MIVFVYGTLKRGYGLNHLLNNSRFLGKATTGPNYTLLKGLNFPYLVERSGVGARGELYEVDPITLMRLDRAEGHPHFYQRKLINVRDDSGNSRQVYAYIHPDDMFMRELVEVFEWER